MRRLADRIARSLLAATFIAAATIPAASAATPYTDIADSQFKADIEWLHAAGITAGCTATTFCPTRKVTRSEMASFLVRMFDLTAGASTDAFDDDDGTTHELDINRLAFAGYTKGCSVFDPRLFCPTKDVRRDEMATFLARLIPLTIGNGRDYFRDDDGNTHEPSIDRAAAAGIASGCATWKFCPVRGVERGQMAAFLHRVVAPVTPPPYPAPTSSAETRHVATTGTDASNDCSDAGAPCRTMAHTLLEALPGDTIRIGPGTFHEANLVVDDDIAIEGHASGTTIDGDGAAARVLIISPGSTVSVSRLTITDGGRGGIRNSGALTLTNVSIVANRAPTGSGAGIYSDGSMTVLRSTIRDNVALFEGGGIYLRAGPDLIAGSTITGNSSTQPNSRGGGLYLAAELTPQAVSNVTLTNNIADVGGAIFAEFDSTVKNATITGNTGRLDAGGIHTEAGAASIRNSLVIGNVGGNVDGPTSSTAGSMIAIPSGLTLADILDPAGLADNGGPTRTIALVDQSTNPAIDAAVSATCAAAPVNGIDQRGLPRPAACDVGAFEIQ
jgi:hypothetical protein